MLIHSVEYYNNMYRSKYSARLLESTRLVLEYSNRYNLTNNLHFPEDGGSYEGYHGFQKAYEARTAQINIGISH
jgi:hypothetical protein